MLREVGKVAVGGQAWRIPVPSWRLHTDLSREGTKGRGGVEGPVAPDGASELSRRDMLMMAAIASRPLASAASS